ncbi:MAG TPA: acyltransferase [Urbifossiella sp.]|nr:acyltransferase [Urbifossiella sp.]
MRYTNIQFLRVAAAVGVVLFHLGCHAPVLVGADPAAFRHTLCAGFPVPLFFAVSGFVLAHALRGAAPGRFLVARFLRLYPGYWLAVLLTLGLMRAGALTEHHRWLPVFVGGVTLSLWPAGPDAVVVYPLGVEWSLIYEVFLSAALAVFGLVGRGRVVAVLAAAWLVGLGVKAVVAPGFAFDARAHWSTIGLSAYAAPFLLGVLVYQVRGADRRWAWLAAPAALGCLVAACTRPVTLEQLWGLLGLAAAGVVWLAVALPQASERNRLARLGDCTYGLFLIHVPLMMGVLHAAARAGWAGWEPAALALGVALAGGLLFGRLECAVHARLRPLAKADARALLTRARRVLRVKSASAGPASRAP